jgi:hypothetical protein
MAFRPMKAAEPEQDYDDRANIGNGAAAAFGPAIPEDIDVGFPLTLTRHRPVTSYPAWFFGSNIRQLVSSPARTRWAFESERRMFALSAAGSRGRRWNPTISV